MADLTGKRDSHAMFLWLPFPQQAGGKGNRKHTPCSHDHLFLDRKGRKAIANAHQVHNIAFSSTGRGKRLSQSHKLESRITYFARLSMRSVFSAPHGPRVLRDQAKSFAKKGLFGIGSSRKSKGKQFGFHRFRSCSAPWKPEGRF